MKLPCLLKPLGEVAVTLAWWLLPLISREGGLHSSETVARLSSYVMWALFGIVVSCMFAKGWIKETSRASPSTDQPPKLQPKP